MMGTFDCVYETPCGWCSKWDKKCDRNIPERGQRVKCNPVDDAADKTLVNKMCKSESDHEQEICTYSTSSAGMTYRCRNCGDIKTEPYDFGITIACN